jgi:hypothetical protein
MPYMVPQERNSGTVIWGGDDLGLLYSYAGAIRCGGLYSVATSADSRPAASAADAARQEHTADSITKRGKSNDERDHSRARLDACSSACYSAATFPKVRCLKSNAWWASWERASPSPSPSDLDMYAMEAQQ